LDSIVAEALQDESASNGRAREDRAIRWPATSAIEAATNPALCALLATDVAELRTNGKSVSTPYGPIHRAHLFSISRQQFAKQRICHTRTSN
jgi:hypothetical protein